MTENLENREQMPGPATGPATGDGRESASGPVAERVPGSAPESASDAVSEGLLGPVAGAVSGAESAPDAVSEGLLGPVAGAVPGAESAPDAAAEGSLESMAGVAPGSVAEQVPGGGPALTPVGVGVEAESASEGVSEGLAEPGVGDKRPWRRRGLVVAGGLVALGVLVGGVGFTVVTVQDADRDPGAPTWKFPRTVADDEEAQGEASGLRGLLLPYEDDLYMPGPDLAEFGSDVELSGRQATALRKESIKDLPRSARREMEKEIDKQRITGMVMRSYLYAEPFAVSDDKTFTVSVVLSQMENRNAVRGISTSQNDVFAALDIFREGPKIKGHKNARCFLTPEVEESGIDRMICSAYQGDVLVNATASGIGPLDSKAVATFLADQLDRIDTPGEAV